MKSGIIATVKITRSSHARKDGRYTASLQVTHNRFSKKYVLKIGDGLDRIVFSQEEFDNIASTRPKKHLKNYKYIFSQIEQMANEIISQMEFFSFKEFEQLFFKPEMKIQNDLFVFLDKKMQSLEAAEKNSTLVTFKTTKKHLSNFYKQKKLPFQVVTPDFLLKFEKWMLDTAKIKSKNTVGIYMRNIRTLYNEAIDLELIHNKYYPFGKKKYQIPSKQKETIKALTKEEVVKISKYKTPNKGKQWARDMWIFSYLCNGMNIKDICNLKYEDIKGDKIVFIREKTKEKTRSNQISIEIKIHKRAHSIIKKWGNKNKESYIFPVFSDKMTAKEKKTKVDNLNNYVTKNIKKIAKDLEISKKVTAVYARHTFATLQRDAGVPIAIISKALGHQDIATTVNYLGKLDDGSLKKMSFNLL